MPNLAVVDMEGKNVGTIELRRKKTLETERNWSCKTGFNKSSTVDTRRRCIRSEAKRLQIFRKQEGKKTCYEVSFLFKGYGERAHRC